MIHVDATGEVVRETARDPKLFKTGKKNYYCIVRLSLCAIIPIAEYLSTTQTASAITNWLVEF